MIQFLSILFRLRVIVNSKNINPNLVCRFGNDFAIEEKKEREREIVYRRTETIYIFCHNARIRFFDRILFHFSIVDVCDIKLGFKLVFTRIKSINIEFIFLFKLNFINIF